MLNYVFGGLFACQEIFALKSRTAAIEGIVFLRPLQTPWNSNVAALIWKKVHRGLNCRE